MSRHSTGSPSSIRRVLVASQVFLLIAALFAPLPVAAEDPTPDPQATASPSEPASPSPEPSPDVTSEPTTEPPVATPEPTGEPTQDAMPEQTAPTLEATPQPTQDQTVEPTAMPQAEPSAGEAATSPDPTESLESPAVVPARIWTGKQDYVPYELVDLNGEGWQSGESIDLFINDDEGQTWSHRESLVADEFGNFFYEFRLPSWFVATYSVRATGTSGEIVRTDFADSIAQGGFATNSNSATNGSASAELTINAPAVVAGDVLVAQIVAAKDFSGTQLICTPTGWTSIVRNDFQNKVVQQTFYRVATADALQTSYIWQFRNSLAGCGSNANANRRDGTGGTGGIIRYTGVDTANPIMTFATASAAGSSTTAVAPGVTTTAADAQILRFFAVFKNLTITPAARIYSVGASNNAERTAGAFESNQGAVGSSGTFNATLSSSAEWAAQTIALQMAAPANTLPVCQNVLISTNEDATGNANPNCTDADSDPLTYAIVAQGTNGTASVVAGQLQYQPNANFNGADSFTYRANDGTGNSNTATVSVTVNAVNDAPSFTKGAGQAVDEDAAAQSVPGWATAISAGPANEAGQVLDFIVTNDNSALFAAQPAVSPTGTLSFAPAPDANGSAIVTVRVHDDGGTANSGVDTSAPQTFTISVRPVNDQPNATDSSVTVAEDGSAAIDLDALVGDVETSDANLNYAIHSGPTYGLLSGVGSSKTYTPSGDFNGSDSFTYSVTDRGDPDGCTPVAIGVCTAALSSVVRTVSITVTEVNDRPVGQDDPASVDEDGTVEIDVLANDSAGPADESSQTLSITDVGAPAHGAATLDTHGTPSTADDTIDYAPTANYHGTDTFTYVVCDDGTTDGVSDPTCAVAVTTVNVSITSVNDPPLLGAVGDKSVDELETLTFTTTATDVDTSDTLTFSLTGAPAGASIGATSGAFSWTPTEAQGPGSYTFTVVVTDDGSAALSDTETITVTVNEVNLAPVLGAIGDQTVDEQTSLAFTAGVTDPDLPANGLTFSLTGAPAGASIGATSGAFSWTPTEAQGPGSYTFTVVVTDDGSPALSDTETITVTVNEVNLAPVLGAMGSSSLDEGDTLSFTATASDADIPANALTFDLVGAPAGASIDPSSGAFSWTAPDDGVFTFEVRVTDNSTPTMHDSETITVTVANVAPTIELSGATTSDEGATYSLTFGDVTDPGDDTVSSYTVHWGDGDTGVYTADGVVTHVYDDGPDSHIITVDLTDEDGAFANVGSPSITVTVANVAPTIVALGSSPSAAIVGQTIVVTGTATDPSVADSAAGFAWRFDTGSGYGPFGSPGANTVSKLVTVCGPLSIKAQAGDKDGGLSAEYTLTVQTFAGKFLSPLKEGVSNVVQKGRVIPVQIDFGCGGHLGGLQPEIQLLRGDFVANAGTEDVDDNLVTISVSGADTTGVMREVDSKYKYNLAIPSTGMTGGQPLTVRIRPFGPGTQPTMYILLEIKK